MYDSEVGPVSTLSQLIENEELGRQIDHGCLEKCKAVVQSGVQFYATSMFAWNYMQTRNPWMKHYYLRFLKLAGSLD